MVKDPPEEELVITIPKSVKIEPIVGTLILLLGNLLILGAHRIRLQLLLRMRYSIDIYLVQGETLLISL